jgi:hypothetical protein
MPRHYFRHYDLPRHTPFRIIIDTIIDDIID